MTQSKAKIATVKIGPLAIEGLLLPDGSFAVGVSQISALFPAIQNNPSREVKALLGKGIQLVKAASELNPNRVNIVSLEQFSLVVFELALKGQSEAVEFVRALHGLSLHQLFSDAFGIKFEADDRQEWLKQRMLHKKQFHPNLTRWLQADGCKEGKDYAAAVNRFKACANLPIKPVAEYSEDELTLLNNAEVSYNMARKLGHSHDESLRYL